MRGAVSWLKNAVLALVLSPLFLLGVLLFFAGATWEHLRYLVYRRWVWESARRSGAARMNRCERSRNIDPAEALACGLGELPAGWSYTLGTVVASIAMVVPREDHWEQPVGHVRRQGVIGFFDDRRTLRLARMPTSETNTIHSFDESDEMNFHVGRHYIVSFGTRRKDVCIFCEVRPIIERPKPPSGTQRVSSSSA
jgi:hypothetical protein